ncbi:RagB/SusD family nutrient uptake outer membrane protein [Capnocytophaga catalasegens]|uniref:Starch-binding protein n=1 Tax=Capnocytophaga catalasegens TaxID=1004260 RepID=A0AAV5AXH2_9FLAO|nr:RagB/SusD family nutrient uptake outer membrane protein [Capnocytophaga catalasegens]GIZ15678.1 starch-binding protein [Capnocytophaga catalasegens]GJM50065.1 starch-binding protein [Capnocytophaga catalasegens]GJM53110.1 starch-binding protein [Capnocytophaga catalasegens]
MLKISKYSIIHLSISVLIGSLVSCDVLDTKVDIYNTDQQIQTNYKVLYDFGYAAYTRLQNRGYAIDNNLFAAVSDEAEYTYSPSSTQIFNEGSWNAFTNPDNSYLYNYEGIRAATYFLETYPNYVEFLKLNRNLISTNDINEYQRDVKSIRYLRFENRVLRAYFYFELLKRFGGVPIVKNLLDSNDNTHLPRNSVDEVVDYIVSEIDASKDSLVTNWGTDFQDIGLDGRITKGAALALKSRVLLYAASPLFNPGNDATKWQAAASAANELLSLNLYSLDPNYSELFIGDKSTKSSETIFAIRQGATNDLEKSNYPIGTAGGNSGITPSHNLVNAYEYKGIPNPDDPYANRDPRLGFSIVTNNSKWNDRTIEIWEGGTDDFNNKNASRTGYYLKKFLNENLNLIQDEKKLRSWIVFRLAEIYLNYAEAMNEAYGPNNSNGYGLTAEEALNKVRSRPGVEMPPITTSSKDEFREKVKHERRIELAFEEHRYWDLRRWKDAITVLNSPLRGVRPTKNGTHFTYDVKEVEKRVFLEKMYLHPIPQSEIAKSQGILTQNPGW